MVIIIPKDVKYILSVLEKNNFEAFVVGGCVRDSILNRTPKDWDITTNALPDQIKEIFNNEDKFKVLPIGERFGMIAVILNGIQYEITTYRIDGEYSDDRHPEDVFFTNDIVKDLSRRDFTMNAIAYNEESGFVDPFDGIKDIENRIIRCVRNPIDRFNEDKLRILRAVRFEAQLQEVGSFKLDEEIDKYIEFELENNSLINISNERIFSEISKILMSKGMGASVFRKYPKIFAQTNIFPFINQMNGFSQNSKWHIFDVYEHTIHAMENVEVLKSKLYGLTKWKDFKDVDMFFKELLDDDLVLRLATFFHDTGKPEACIKDDLGYCHFKGHVEVSAKIAEEYLTYLRFSNKIKNEVVELVEMHEQELPMGNNQWRKMLSKHGELQTKRFFVLRCLDKSAQNPFLNYSDLDIKISLKHLMQTIETSKCFKVTDLAINGRDLIRLGFEPGPNFKMIFDILLELVITEKIKNNSVDLLEYVKKHFL